MENNIKMYSSDLYSKPLEKMDTSDIFILEPLRAKIESMNKERHIQALNILVKYQNITINEPKYGNVNVNLSRIPKEAVEDLLKFVSYVEDQESSLQFAEEQKKKYQDVFFNELTPVSNSSS